MSGSLLLWLTLAMLVFWAVGLYNRLMRMRARAFSAFGSVEKHLREYVELTRELTMNAQRESGYQTLVQRQESIPHLALLLAELELLELALRDARLKPLAIEPIAGVQQAIDALKQVWQGLLTLPGDLAGPALPEDMQARWNAISHRVETSRNGYNQILLNYNEALAQFPASLIVGFMGVKPSGLL
jgi:LemA protein